MKKINNKTIILISVILILCTVIGISIGKYLFEMTHPNIDLIVKIFY